MAGLIIRVVYEGSTYDLDIEKEIPLRLDVSSVENTRIGQYFGVGSQSFVLPGTKENNTFFKHGYTGTTEDIPAFYNSIDGYIIYNGETLLEGQFQLLEIIADEEGYVSYKCQITDTVVQFNDALANKLIKNGNWDYLNHALTYQNIEDSWDDNLLGGSVYYPIAQYGFDEPDQIQQPWFSFGGSPGNYLDNSLTPILAQQLLPAVRVKDTLDVIFEQVGFRYTGTFVNEPEFNQLYILPKAQDRLGIVGEPGELPLCSIANSNNVSVSPGTSTVPFDLEYSDPQNAFDTTTGYYNTSGAGSYTFSVNTSFFNPTAFTGGSVTITLDLMVGTAPSSGTVIASQTVNLDSTYGFNTVFMNLGGTANISAGPNVWVRVTYTINSGSAGNLLLYGFGTRFECTDAPANTLGTTVNMGLQFQGETKSIDLLNGLVQQFNLVITPVEGERRLLSIDTFDTWMRNGEKKDWTDKYNTAVRKSINHTVDEQPKELLLKAADDTDRFSKSAIDADPNYQYGTLRLLADNNLSQGNKKIGDYFAPVVLGGPFTTTTTGTGTSGDGTLQIDQNNNFIFPHLYKFENSTIKSYAFKPRIGYKVTNNFQGSFYIGEPGGSPSQITNSYTTISNVASLPVTDGTKDLHFNNTYTKLTATNNLNGSTTAFTSYWKTYLDSLYWENSNKLVLDIVFSQYEYKDIKLNDKIFIKDTYYRINKISGYNLTSKDTATVELIKLYPAYFEGQAAPQGCDFEVSASYSAAGCGAGPTATPFPTSTPTPTPTSTPSGATPTPTGLPPTPTPVPTSTPTSTAIGPTSTPIPPTATPPTVYYARFVTCDDPGGLIIQVQDSSPIDTSIVLFDNGDCYQWYSSGGTGVDGDIDTFTQYASCEACGIPPTATPAPTAQTCFERQLVSTVTNPAVDPSVMCEGNTRPVFINSSTLSTATQHYANSDCSSLNTGTRYLNELGSGVYYISNNGIISGPYTLNCP